MVTTVLKALALQSFFDLKMFSFGFLGLWPFNRKIWRLFNSNKKGRSIQRLNDPTKTK